MFNYLISVRCSMFNLAMIVVLTCVPVGILYNDNYLMFVKRCSMFNRVMFNVVCVVYQYLVLFRPICHHPTLISLKSHPFICLLLFPTHSLSLFIKFSHNMVLTADGRSQVQPRQSKLCEFDIKAISFKSYTIIKAQWEKNMIFWLTHPSPRIPPYSNSSLSSFPSLSFIIDTCIGDKYIMDRFISHMKQLLPFLHCN